MTIAMVRAARQNRIRKAQAYATKSPKSRETATPPGVPSLQVNRAPTRVIRSQDKFQRLSTTIRSPVVCIARNAHIARSPPHGEPAAWRHAMNSGLTKRTVVKDHESLRHSKP